MPIQIILKHLLKQQFDTRSRRYKLFAWFPTVWKNKISVSNFCFNEKNLMSYRKNISFIPNFLLPLPSSFVLPYLHILILFLFLFHPAFLLYLSFLFISFLSLSPLICEQICEPSVHYIMRKGSKGCIFG